MSQANREKARDAIRWGYESIGRGRISEQNIVDGAVLAELLGQTSGDEQFGVVVVQDI